MKALILAGGTGTRLYPTTKFYNKHLIHVYDKPMIMYAIENVKKSGIDDIIISISKDKPELFIEYLGDGSDFDVNLTYTIQNKPMGIAYAIYQARKVLDGDKKFMVYLADNFFEKSLENYIDEFYYGSNDVDSLVLVKESKEPERYGVAFIDDEGFLIEAAEKPLNPTSNKIIIGVYFFTHKYFQVFRNIKPSGRNEYEIIDILNRIGKVRCCPYGGEWYDLGTSDDIVNCSKKLLDKKIIQEKYNK